MSVARTLVSLIALAVPALSATFGTVVTSPGGASYSDIVLDEARSRVYLVNSNSNRIDVYNYKSRSFLNAISTDPQPVSAALSRDGRSLFVTAYTAAELDVIDLNAGIVSNRISLTTGPEGVAVGADGRVLITAVANGASTANTLQIYNPAGSGTLISVPVVPAPPTPPVLPSPSGRIFTSYRSGLAATPDGKWIIGVNGPTAATKVVFVYEVASGTVLRSRNVTNLSSTISVSPDGSRFMAGATLFDTQTLQVIAQENTANAPFSFPAAAPGTAAANFNLQANQGGSVFAPDDSVLYAAFNIAPIGAVRPSITQLLVNDPDNLLINTGLEIPENLAGKMVIDAAGANIYAISDSGLTVLPVSTIGQSPLAVPHAQSVLLTNDQCGIFNGGTASDPVDNPGKGKITISVAPVVVFPGGPGGPVIITTPPTASAVNSGAAPSVSFRYNPAIVNPGTVGPSDFSVVSGEAINIPDTIHVFQNNRDSVSAGTIIPVPINAVSTEGLTDILFDGARKRIYIANSGLNRIEVFDVNLKQLLAPIKVGQLPHGIAMGSDGTTMYVANTGGESVSIVDPGKSVQTGRVIFPALPFNVAATVAVINPVAIAATGLSPLIVMSNGSTWKISGNPISGYQAIPKPLNPAVFGVGATSIPGGAPAQWTLASTPGGEYAILLSGTGNAYLYDYTVDDFVLSKQVLTLVQGYVGPVTAGPQGRYYAVGGTILNSSLTRVQGGTNGTSPLGRLVAAVTAVSGTQLAEFTEPLRGNPTAPVTDAGMIELYDPATGATAGSTPVLEGPSLTVTGLTRVNGFARTLAIDSAGGTAYALTATGLSVIPLGPAPSNAATRPSVNAGGVVNLGNMQPALAPGGLLAILGRNLGSSATATAPLPTLLGGVCVTLNNQPVPLSMTSAGQINGQVPVTLAPGRYPLVVRSIDNQSVSGTTTVTVAKYAPAVLVDNNGQAAIMHQDGTFANQSHPAKRDETLLIYATGLGVTHGGPVTSGAAAPASPLAVTDSVQVYFGNPLWVQGQVIVKLSYLLPGMVGIDQITVTVPGFHIKGSSLPVTLKIGGVSSPVTGSAVPYVAVN
jgi:uncharacterized protein (TIGR03437 family)